MEFFKTQGEKIMINEFMAYIAMPSAWFSVGAVFVAMTYTIIYDILWTWIFKDHRSNW